VNDKKLAIENAETIKKVSFDKLPEVWSLVRLLRSPACLCS
jgi:hypothetical protein